MGRISKKAQKLIDVTREALYKAIAVARKGNNLSDVSHAVQFHVEKSGFSVVRDFVGHGIGRELHEAPQIPNYGEPHHGVKLRSGMVLAIEPMVNAGRFEVEVLKDNWTVVSQDGSVSTHFEHTVVLNENGAEVVTE